MTGCKTDFLCTLFSVSVRIILISEFFLIKLCSSLNISASLQIISCSFSGTFVTNLVYLQVPKEYQSPLCSPPFKYHQADMGHPSEGFKVQDLSVIYCIHSSFLFLSLFCSMHPFPKW